MSETQEKFHYEVKAPDRVYWHFRGTFAVDFASDTMYSWMVEVTQESNDTGIYFEMKAKEGVIPSLVDVFSAFQANVASLLNPIAWDIHYHRNTGMQ